MIDGVEAPMIDDQAVDRLSDEPLGPGYKGLLTEESVSIRDLVRRDVDLLSAPFTFPLATINESALENNIRGLAEYCRDRGLAFAPHGKTTMSPQLFSRQLRSGAYAITAATVSQAKLYRSFRIRRILLANEVVDPRDLDWIVRARQHDPSLEFIHYVDSPESVRAAVDALNRATGPQSLRVLIEVGYAGGRTGCRTPQQIENVLVAASQAKGVQIAGVAGFEGLIGHDSDAHTLDRVGSYLGDLRKAAEFVAANAEEMDSPYIVSVGGSSYFDLVADEFAVRTRLPADTKILLRCGGYVVHDRGIYADSTPSRRNAGPDFLPALNLWGRVLSRPEPRLALVGLGRRDCSFDSGFPVPELVWQTRDDGPRPLRGTHIRQLDDQHAYLDVSGLRGDALVVGDLIRFGISHPCTTFDKWRIIPVLDDSYRVVDSIRTFF